MPQTFRTVVPFHRSATPANARALRPEPVALRPAVSPAPKDPEPPSAHRDDDEDTAWALCTARSLWHQNERKDAIEWVRRATRSAAEAGNEDRALELARAASDLAQIADKKAQKPTPTAVTSPPPSPPVAVKPAAPRAASLPPPVPAAMRAAPSHRPTVPPVLAVPRIATPPDAPRTSSLPMRAPSVARPSGLPVRAQTLPPPRPSGIVPAKNPRMPLPAPRMPAGLGEPPVRSAPAMALTSANDGVKAPAAAEAPIIIASSMHETDKPLAKADDDRTARVPTAQIRPSEAVRVFVFPGVGGAVIRAANPGESVPAGAVEAMLVALAPGGSLLASLQEG